MKVHVVFKCAVLWLTFSSCMAASLQDLGLRVETSSGEANRLQDMDVSRGMGDAHRRLMLKSLDSDIKDVAAEEAQQRKSGSIVKADRLKLQLDALRAKRAIYDRAPD